MEELQTPEGVLLVQEPRESPVRQFAAKWILAWEELQQRVRQRSNRYWQSFISHPEGAAILKRLKLELR
jgi:hypothetical protein